MLPCHLATAQVVHLDGCWRIRHWRRPHQTLHYFLLLPIFNSCSISLSIMFNCSCFRKNSTEPHQTKGNRSSESLVGIIFWQTPCWFVAPLDEEEDDVGSTWPNWKYTKTSVPIGRSNTQQYIHDPVTALSSEPFTSRPLGLLIPAVKDESTVDWHTDNNQLSNQHQSLAWANEQENEQRSSRESKELVRLILLLSLL